MSQITINELPEQISPKRILKTSENPRRLSRKNRRQIFYKKKRETRRIRSAQRKLHLKATAGRAGSRELLLQIWVTTRFPKLASSRLFGLAAIQWISTSKEKESTEKESTEKWIWLLLLTKSQPRYIYREWESEEKEREKRGCQFLTRQTALTYPYNLQYYRCRLLFWRSLPLQKGVLFFCPLVLTPLAFVVDVFSGNILDRRNGVSCWTAIGH